MVENWISRFAQQGLGILQKAIPGKQRIGEITVSQGEFSNEFLRLLPDTTELYRTDFPLQEFNIMSKQLLPFPIYFVPGHIYKQLYPSGSMDLIYAFQVFNQLSRSIYSKEHLLSTLSQSPHLRKTIVKYQENDLAYLLDLRFNELKSKGELVFDLLLMPEESPDPYSWDCLDLAVQLFSNTLTPEQRKVLNLNTSFRTSEGIKNVLKSFDSKYEVLDFLEAEVKMPSYEQFLHDKDIDKYTQTLVEFWKYPITMMIFRVFKGTLKVAEADEKVEKIMEYFREICRDMKPKTVQTVAYLRLGKH